MAGLGAVVAAAAAWVGAVVPVLVLAAVPAGAAVPGPAAVAVVEAGLPVAGIRRDGFVHGIWREINEKRLRLICLDPARQFGRQRSHDMINLPSRPSFRRLGGRWSERDTRERITDFIILNKAVRRRWKIRDEAIIMIKPHLPRAGGNRLTPVGDISRR